MIWKKMYKTRDSEKDIWLMKMHLYDLSAAGWKKMKIPTKKNRWGYLHGKSRPTLLSTTVYILGQ